jgi:hypothetical protein
MSFMLNPLYGILQKIPTLNQVLAAEAISSNQQISIQGASSVLFQNNIKCYWGNSQNSSIMYDGTDMIVNPQDGAGTGIVKLGPSADRNIQLNKIGLGTTAVSTLFWINFVKTTSSGRGALNFDYTYTGAGPSANILSKILFQGSSATPLVLPMSAEVVKDQDQTGTGVYGTRSILGTAATRSITQGVSNMYAFKAERGGAIGTGHTGGTLREYGFWMPTFSAYTGLATYVIWGVNVGHDIQAQDNIYFIFGGSDTVKATNRMRWNTATSAIETDVNAVLQESLAANLRTYKDAFDFAFGTTTGTKHGTATTQKQSFWNATPIVQPANTVAIDTLLVNTGLRASGGVALFDTDVKAGVVGKGYYIKEGTNATMGVATMVAGTVVVNTTKVTATSRIMLTPQNASGTAGSVSVSARTAGTSFTILSTNILDTRDVAWIIFEPA